jgi:phosphoribosylaminoimidazolecarboxamide formyltransferase/IMP cyclohydrolase
VHVLPHRALLSVADKSGIVDLARSLAEAGVELISTGGTATLLREAGLAVTPVAEITGFPEIFDGRVKTLHPRIHGGILGRWDHPEDREAARAHGIEPIGLVVVNLYPFRETVARPGVEPDEAIEQIDIGGPAMIRASAKNHAHTTVVVDPADYGRVAEAVAGGGIELELRRALALKAFRHTAAYDAAIAAWMSGGLVEPEPLPETLVLEGRRVASLRYGENPHQQAAFYALPTPAGRPSLARAEQLHGKELSYNNLLDLDAALGVALDLAAPGAVAIKHTNPCGAAEGAPGESLTSVWRRARATDPTSVFGGIVALNVEVDAETAALLGETFLEAIVAPGYTPEALEALTRKKNLRLLALRPWPAPGPRLDLRAVAGGILAQTADVGRDDLGAARVVTRRAPTAEELASLDFAWRVSKHVKSNAIVFASGRGLLGVGAGQMSRVDSCRIAVQKAGDAGHDLRGSVVASDAFFPFPDGLEVVAAAGATAVAQPGGSVRDEEVIAAADRLGLAMLFTGARHFRH